MAPEEQRSYCPFTNGNSGRCSRWKKYHQDQTPNRECQDGILAGILSKYVVKLHRFYHPQRVEMAKL